MSAVKTPFSNRFMCISSSTQTFLTAILASGNVCVNAARPLLTPGLDTNEFPTEGWIECLQALHDCRQFLLLTGAQKHQTHGEPPGRKSRIETHGIPVSHCGTLQTARIATCFAEQITGRRGTGIDSDGAFQCRHSQIRATCQTLGFTQHVPRINVFRGPLEDPCVRFRAACVIPKTDLRISENEPSVRIAWIEPQPLLAKPREALPVLAFLEVRD